MKFNRSIPFFNALLKSNNNKRIEILQAFPNFVVDDLIEILYNVVLGNIDVSKHKKHLIKHKKTLLNIVNTKTKKARRGVIYNQKGGFLGALIPLILGIASNFLTD